MKRFFALFLYLLPLLLVAEVPVAYEAELTALASSGPFAPYMIGSWNYGKYTHTNGLWHTGRVQKDFDMSKRWSWGAGVEYMLGSAQTIDYRRWNEAAHSWGVNKANPSYAHFQQAYAEVKHRSLFLTIGAKNRHSFIVDDTMSSGDITRSNNSRAIPGIEAGFIDFQNIPFTQGWIQIQGQIMYGPMTDSRFNSEMFNRFNGVLSENLWYTYKRCYFRTNPNQPLSVIAGMQAAGTFAGKSTTYKDGVVTKVADRGFHFIDIPQMFFPLPGGEDFFKGSSLGSWDFKARVRLPRGYVLDAYFEWPWEDGSGIGRRNGWDGVWGLQLKLPKGRAVEKVTVEYVDFVNQSGPIHYSHTDHPGGTIAGNATGGDNYYNNNYYGPYCNYGMSIGSPFVLSPLYNLDGALDYLHNRARGFHCALSGEIVPGWHYRAMASWQKAGGSGRHPAKEYLYDTSAMIEVVANPFARIPQLSVKAQAAFDAGSLRGDNFGGLLSLSYSGNFNLARK